jgi:hypothetical protein
VGVTAPGLPSFALPGNQSHPTQLFQSVERHAPETTPLPIGLDDDDKIKKFVAHLWERSVKQMEPEHDRMRRCQLYYDGFHYEDARLNLENEITNYPFSVVETIWPELIENKPKPEIQVGDGFDERNTQSLAHWADWLMRQNGFDQCFRLGAREFLKLGWVCNVISFDHRTGMPYPKLRNNWDCYPDYSATHEDDAMFEIMAGPVPTAMLRTMFPDRAKEIQPDHWVSPSYDALIRPWKERAAFGGYNSGVGSAIQHVVAYPEASPATSTFLSPPDASYQHDAGDTTFLIQLFYRDTSYAKIGYTGKRWVRARDGMWSWHWDTMVVPELACSSGWRVIQMTANGLILDVAPLDPCYWGLPTTYWRNYENPWRLHPQIGEIDNIIPKTRAINRRLSLLNLALEYQSNPVALIDKNSGIRLDKGAITAGDALMKNAGSRVEWMEIRGPVEQQFNLLARESGDIEMLSGAYDASRGERPTGIEAGYAIQRLQDAASRRVRAKEPGMFSHYSLLLKKLMTCALMKLNRRIQFRASNGQLVTIDPQQITGEFGIKFVPGTGTTSSRNDRRAEAIQLFQLGGIDREELLKTVEWPDAGTVALRMQQQDMMQAEAAAQAAASRPAPKGKAA